MDMTVRDIGGWVGGFVDGEGSIRLEIGTTNTGIGYRVIPIVQVKQKDRTSITVLEEYCEYVGANSNVIENKSKDINVFICEGQSNVKSFLKPIRRQFVVKRGEVDIMLDDILPHLEDGNHHDRRGFIRLMEMSDRLNEHKGAGSDRKYTLAYFENKWGMSLTENYMED